MNYDHEILTFSDDHPIRLFINKIDAIATHWHQALEISVVIDGSLKARLADKIYAFQKGDVFIVNSNVIHSLEGDNTLLLTLQLRLDMIEHLSSEVKNAVYEERLDEDQSKEVRRIMAAMLKNNQSKDPSVQMLRISLTYQLLYFLYNSCRSAEEKENGQNSLGRISSIIAYINSEYQKDISLQTIAENEYLSTAYLSRYFKKNIGMNFSDYLQDVRLNKAMQYILNDDDSIEEIAGKVGFPSARSFVAAFKKKYQTNPSKYRKEHKGDSLSTFQLDFTNKDRAFNYLNDDYNNDRILITRFIAQNEKENASVNSERSSVTPDSRLQIIRIDSKEKGKETRKNFLTMIGGGRVQDVLDAEYQEELKELQREISFSYIKLHSVFDDDMLVADRHDGHLHFNFDFVDAAYDFLLSVHIKPLVQLSFMPSCLAADPKRRIFLDKTVISMPEDMAEWKNLCTSFLHHLLNRYGKKEVDSWLFTVWNEPATSNKMFGLKDEDYYSLYLNTYFALKNIDPELKFGGPSSFSCYGKEDDWLYRFLDFAKENNAVPDFVSVHYYDIDLSFLNDPVKAKEEINRIWLSPKEDTLHEYLVKTDNVLKQKGITVPLMIAEWNNTVSHNDLLSDTCFKSSYIFKNILENNELASSFSYWSLTDRMGEKLLPKELLHGGVGLFTYNGIKKPSYYAYAMLAKTGKYLITRGKGYAVYKDENDDYQICLYNYVPYSEDYSKNRSYQISMRSRDAFIIHKPDDSFELDSDLNGTYLEIQTSVSPEHGSVYDLWTKISQVDGRYLDPETLSSLSHPYVTYREIYFSRSEKPVYTLKPWEIRLVELKKKY